MTDEHLELLKRIAKDVADIKAAMSAGVVSTASALGVQIGSGSSGGPGGVASNADLDSPYGDEKIRMNPRDWRGESFKGSVMSLSDPSFLDMYADTMTYFAGKNADAKKAGYDHKSAARARGWAARLRAGWKPKAGGGGGAGPAAPPVTDEDYGSGDDEVPF